MSASTSQDDEVIVIHPLFRGEAHASAEIVRENAITTVILPDRPVVGPPKPVSPIDALTTEAPATGTRAYGVDAYRGFFLLLMTFAMTIPLREGLFPQWMYHMQYP